MKAPANTRRRPARSIVIATTAGVLITAWAIRLATTPPSPPAPSDDDLGTMVLVMSSLFVALCVATALTVVSVQQRRQAKRQRRPWHRRALSE